MSPTVTHWLVYGGIALVGVLLMFGPQLLSGIRAIGTRRSVTTVPSNPTGDDAFHAAMVLTRFAATGKESPEYKPVMAAVRSALESIPA